MPVTAADTARHLRARAADQTRAAEARAAHLLSVLPAAADLLRTRYGVTDVVLFGSMATGTFTDRSDVDIAARSLDPASYFTALADLMALFASPVDLVRLEQAPPSLLDRIASEGTPL